MTILNSLAPRFNYNLLFLLFFLSLVSCGTSCGQSLRTPPDTLVVGIEVAPLTLDPRLASDAYSAKLTQLLHNGLFKLSDRLELVPDLVEHFEQNTPTSYRFKLKAGIHFHNGKELGAEDVKYTLESVLDPALASPFRGTMMEIESIEVKDPLTLEIKLKEPFAPFLSALTMGIIPKKGPNVIEDPFMGTGPFRLESFRPAEGVVLKKNDSYFLGAPKINRVSFRVVTDDNLRVLELRSHRIDLLQNNVPPILLKTLKARPDLVFETTEGINMSYLGLNLRGPLQKPEVRQAMAMALNVPALIEYRMENLARPATGILSPIHWAYEGNVTHYPFDPKKARELLDQAGLVDPDGDGPAPRFSLSYKTSTKKDRIGLARLIARYLKDVGIEIKILPYEWGTFFHDIQTGNFEIYSLTWVGVTEPDIFYYAFHSSQTPPTGANRGFYKNPLVDQLTEEGRHLSDRTQRKGVYSLVQKQLAEDLPLIPLWYEDNFAIFSNQVKGVRLRSNASFEWATEVYKE